MQYEEQQLKMVFSYYEALHPHSKMLLWERLV